MKNEEDVSKSMENDSERNEVSKLNSRPTFVIIRMRTGGRRFGNYCIIEDRRKRS